LIKILFVASEVNPFIKSGGLGDVAGSLPRALAGLGADVRVVLPSYSGINFGEFTPEYVTSFEVKFDWRKPVADIFVVNAACPTYFIANGHYFNRDNIYGYGDDFERFAFFSKAALTLLPSIDFKPDIIHFNDWQTGLGPVYLKDSFQNFLFYRNIKSIFTIHNLQYQGTFAPEVLPQVDLNYGYFVPDKLEFFGAANYMKAGLTYSDFITTVSPTYAKEIQTSEYGYGLEGLLSSRSHQLLGILNGIDYDEFNPETCRHVPANFSAHDNAGKAATKAHVQQMLGLPVNPRIPVFAMVTRLVEQKGLDILAAAMDEITQRDMQLIVLGNGHSHFEQMLTNTARYHPHKISANIKFDATLAHQFYAAADFFLMPSLFEPCGLGQLIAMRYGALPIVRKTGGLADTVVHYNPLSKAGHGILFENYDPYGLKWAIDQALYLYHEPHHLATARQNAMQADFSWQNSAKKYLQLYQNLAQ
jgi:starch synthase